VSNVADQATVAVERIDEVRWRIPRDAQRGMRVDGLVIAGDELMRTLRQDPALEQVANVATLPGIVGVSLAMPDVHWGYGFPIGGVAAVDRKDGVVSPGGIGFDINCGVRLIRSDLTAAELAPRLERLADALFAAVPSGVGARTGHKLGARQLDEVLATGSE
jgi:tRNA-splicing ligase RtcB